MTEKIVLTEWGFYMITEVASILRVCGIGSYLHIGDGKNTAVFELLKRSIDAYGVDPSEETVNQNLEQAPGRFFQGTLTEFPFTPQAVDTIIVGTELINIPESEIPRILKSLHLMTKRNLVFCFPTDAIRSVNNQNKSNRLFWERIVLQAGFRRHPRAMTVSSYMAHENEQIENLMFFERIPDAALERYPLDFLHNKQKPHMDMLRESGRRADAYIWRYMLAVSRIHPGDTVLDAACGLGYGTAALAACSPGSHFIGIDIDPEAIAYAEANYGVTNPELSYRTGDVTQLAFIPDHSIDFVIAFEALMQIENYELFLSEIRRILKPDGRIFGSVPNLWCDETGKDPHPYHLHIFNWEKIQKALSKHFIVDARWAQIAGGGFKIPDGTREIASIDLNHSLAIDTEWWVFSAKADPRNASTLPYTNPFHKDKTTPTPTQVNFEKFYDNPWLYRVLVQQGVRLIDENALKIFCAEIAKTSKPGSADHGAALCVLAYRLFETDKITVKAISIISQHINIYNQACDRNNPHALRWSISLYFIAGRLLLSMGNRDDALAALLTCAEMDPAPLSPILATKTLAARMYAGLILVGNNELEEARKQFSLGMKDAQRLMQGDWKNIIGDFENPLTFSLAEAAEVLNIASQCSIAYSALDKQTTVPGFFWDRINVKFFGFLEWNKSLERENLILRQELQRLVTQS